VGKVLWWWGVGVVGEILPKSGVSGYADKGGIVRGGYTDELGMHSAW